MLVFAQSGGVFAYVSRRFEFMLFLPPVLLLPREVEVALVNSQSHFLELHNFTSNLQTNIPIIQTLTPPPYRIDTAAMDDDEIAAMMADLGHSRRDAVVAPEDRKGLGGFRNDYEKMLDAEEERRDREQALKLNAPPENDKHAKLQKWNIAETFGIDDVAAQQQDRYGGQGHRARMQQELLKYNRNPDGSDAGHGGGGGRGGGRGGRGGGGRGGFQGGRGMFPTDDSS